MDAVGVLRQAGSSDAAVGSQWDMSLWFVSAAGHGSSLADAAAMTEFAGLVASNCRAPDVETVFVPDDGGARCSMIDAEMAAMQAFPASGAAVPAVGSQEPTRFLYRLVGHVFHHHWHALLERVSESFQGFRVFEARMRWGVLPSDGHRISGILEGHPFVVGEQRSDWVMFVFRPFIPAGSLGRVRDWGEPLRSARIPRPVSPLGVVEYSSPMSLLLEAVPVLASRLTHVDASEVPDGIVSGR